MKLKRSLLCASLIMIISYSSGQVNDYILKSISNKVLITTLNLSPDGSKLLAGYQDGSFSILERESLTEIVKVEDAHLKAVAALEMSPKMDFILSAGHTSIKLWDTLGTHITNWKGQTTNIRKVDISSNGTYAVSSGFNKTFMLWDAQSGSIIQKMTGHSDVTFAVAISPDSRLIASGSNDQKIKIWDIESRQCITTLHGPTSDVYDVKFSPDGKLVAACSKDKSVRIYDIGEEKLVRLLKGHRELVLEIEFSPNGRYILTASADQTIMLWDVETGERIYSFIENEGALLDIVFHPDGSSFYSSARDNTLKHWDLNPEIFVLKYFEDPYTEEIAGNVLFEERRKGESKKDYIARMTRADKKRAEIVDTYYQQYLERFE